MAKPTWISDINPSSGSGPGTTTVYVEAEVNPTSSERTGTLTVKGGGISKNLDLYQAPAFNYQIVSSLVTPPTLWSKVKIENGIYFFPININNLSGTQANIYIYDPLSSFSSIKATYYDNIQGNYSTEDNFSSYAAGSGKVWYAGYVTNWAPGAVSASQIQIKIFINDIQAAELYK